MKNEPIINRDCPKPPIKVISTPTIAGLKQHSNAFVSVVETGETFFVDNAHKPTLIYAAPLFVDNYDYENNPRGLRAQVVYDFANNLEVIYNARGKYRLVKLEKGI